MFIESFTSRLARTRRSYDAGDILVIYTDGITEATGEGGEEFGEGRVVDVIRNESFASVPSILDAVLNAVQKFGGSEQADDLTLVVARGR